MSLALVFSRSNLAAHSALSLHCALNHAFILSWSRWSASLATSFPNSAVAWQASRASDTPSGFTPKCVNRLITPYGHCSWNSSMAIRLFLHRTLLYPRLPRVAQPPLAGEARPDLYVQRIGKERIEKIRKAAASLKIVILYATKPKP